MMMLAGVPALADAVAELADTVRATGADALADRLEVARADGVNEHEWRQREGSTLSITGALTLALLLVALAEAFEGWNGLIQRFVLAVPLLWIAVLGMRLARPPASPSSATFS